MRIRPRLVADWWTAVVGRAPIVVLALVAGAALQSRPALAESLHNPHFAPGTHQVSVGTARRVVLRFVDEGGRPLGIKVTPVSVRLDMAPEGMTRLTGVVTSIDGAQPGQLVFDADFNRPGRWAFHISAKVAGYSEPVSDVVTFQATR